MSEILGSIRFLAQNGVVFIEDLDSPEAPPIWEDDDEAVSASGSSVMLRVLHAIDGPASFEIWETAADGIAAVPDLPGDLVFDGRIRAQRGNLRLRDVNEWNSLVAGVEPGDVHVRIYCDVAGEAERTVVLVLTPGPADG